MNWPLLVLSAHAASTLALVGLIWTIQLVHYPAFRFVDPTRFVEFEAFHQRQISLAVVPLMLVELSTAAMLLWLRSTGVPLWMAVAGAGLVLFIWGCTFAVQVPLHNQLAQRYDGAAIEQLVRSNWIRTVAWTLRGGLVLWALWLAAMAGGRMP